MAVSQYWSETSTNNVMVTAKLERKLPEDDNRSENTNSWDSGVYETH